MPVDPFFTLLIGAFGAATLTVVGGFVGAFIQHRREHIRWVREQRLTAYLDYLRLAERITTMPKLTADGVKFLDDLQAASAALRLLGPKPVFSAAVMFTSTAMQYANMKVEPDANRNTRPQVGRAMVEAREVLVAAAQHQLGIHH